MEEEKRLSVRLPKDLHDRFKAAAATNGKTMTKVILEFVTDYVYSAIPVIDSEMDVELAERYAEMLLVRAQGDRQ